MNVNDKAPIAGHAARAIPVDMVTCIRFANRHPPVHAYWRRDANGCLACHWHTDHA